MKSKTIENRIRDALDKGKLVYGYNETYRALSNGKLKAVFVSSTCKESNKKTLKHLSQLSNVEFKELDMNSKSLGILCKRRHIVSALGILE